MERLIISAPFGNYFRFPGCTSTIGTFTLEKRAGNLRRLWRLLTKVRHLPHLKSWANDLELPNPGILSVKNAKDKILSIYALVPYEWWLLCDIASNLNPLAVELNFSCPNVTKTVIEEAKYAASCARYLRCTVIAKLAPIRWMDFVRPLMHIGIDYFHLCNTMASPCGGISGKLLKQYSLWAVEEVKAAGAKVIGGGGVTELQDVKDYINAGADHVAIGSMLFNPFSWKRVETFKKAWGNHDLQQRDDA